MSTSVSAPIDSMRFLNGATRRVVNAWIEREPEPTDIPWTPLAKPLRECTVALLTTSGISLRDGEPFDADRERRDPWWGDPTHRELPASVTSEDIRIDHLHVPRHGERDLDCVLPLGRLDELVAAGEVGGAAAHAISIMGYLLRPQQMLRETVPKIIERLRRDDVDVVLLVPV